MSRDVTPVALIARFTVRPGSEDAFAQVVAETASGIREREPDTLTYACHKVEGQPRQWIFYELYRNRAAFDRHESTEHVRRFLAERTALLEASEVELLDLQDGKTPPGFELDAIIAGTRQRIRVMEERARLLSAILAALDNMDAVRALVENSASAEAAEAGVMELLDIDQTGARSVLHIPVLHLSPGRRQKIGAEYDGVTAEIADLEGILASPERLEELVGTERGADLARDDERLWAGPAPATWSSGRSA